MVLRPALLLFAVALLLGCESGPKHRLKRDCRAQIDDCMDECPMDPGMQDSCFASCRNERCDPPPEQPEQQ